MLMSACVIISKVKQVFFMIPNNFIKPKCLVFSKNINSKFEKLLKSLGYQVFFLNSRKDAFKFLLTHRPALIIVDANLLPKNPNRVFQSFKIAHSTPGMLILTENKHECYTYCWLNGGFFEVIEIPYDLEEIELSLKRITEYLHLHSKNLFYRDILIQAGLALPVLILLTFLLARI